MKKNLLTLFVLSLCVIASQGQLLEISDLSELQNHIGEEVVLLNAEVHAVDEGFYKDYMLSDNVTFVEGFIYCGVFDFQGVYTDGVFSVNKVVQVHGFNTISELDNYVRDYSTDTEEVVFSVLNPMIVTHVEGGNVFVQYEGVNDYGVTMMRSNMLTGIDIDVKLGDKITGVRGVSHPCDYYQDEKSQYHVNRGCYFVLSDDAELSVVSSRNEVDYGSNSVDLPSLQFSAYRYNSSAVSLSSGGNVIAEKGRFYYEVEQYETVENPMTGRYEERLVYYSLELKSNVVDLTSYVDTEMKDLFVGVYNYKNTTENDDCFYVDGVQSTNRGFESISELIARGSASDKIGVLENPAVVSYIFLPDWRNTVALVVQDATGGIFVQFEDESMIEGINIGDSITSIRGVASWGIYASPCIQVGKGSPVTVVSVDNDVLAWKVSLSELCEEYRISTTTFKAPTNWVNRLVELNNVLYSTGVDEYGDERPCLVDGEDVLWLEKDFGTRYNMEVGSYYDVCGIVDYCRLNREYLYTIIPRTVADVWPAGVDGIEIENETIYINAEQQVVARGAASMVIYDINGRAVVNVKDEVTDLVALSHGVYVVQATYPDGTVSVAKIVR